MKTLAVPEIDGNDASLQVATARKVPGTSWFTPLHLAAKYGGAGVKVTEYEVRFVDGKFPTNVTAKDRAQAIQFAQRERVRQIEVHAQEAEMLENPHTISRANYVCLAGGGRLPAEKAADHRRAVEAALGAGKAIPDHVLADYPDLAEQQLGVKAVA